MNRSKLHHVAAALLAGWYLMCPPLLPSDLGIADHAPLSVWQSQGAFESPAACNDKQAANVAHELSVTREYEALSPTQQAKLDAEFAREDKRHSLAVAHFIMAESQPDWSEACQCIATDDPRLRN